MSGVNKVILIGNLGRDPEVRHTQNGQAVAKMNLAVSERRKDGDGWKDHTEWVRVVCFGKTAENAGQYLSKGRQIYVEGRLSTNEYTDKEGVKRWSTEVVAHQVTFIGGGQERASSDRKPNAPADTPAETPDGEPGFYDDDLPF